MIVLILSFVVVASYIGFVSFHTKVISSSLSETYYSLGGYGGLFTACMLITSATLYPVWMGVAKGLECLPFIACSSLFFVALTPAYRMDLQSIIHYCAAVLCGICAVLWQVLAGLWDVTLFFGFIGALFVLICRSKYMFILECAIILSLYVNLLRLV